MIVQKKANQLRKGDKILSVNNHYMIDSVRNSTLTGCTYPLIEVTDRYGKKLTIETGSTGLLQDHIYEVETM